MFIKEIFLIRVPVAAIPVWQGRIILRRLGMNTYDTFVLWREWPQLARHIEVKLKLPLDQWLTKRRPVQQ